jgi:hypothetical protein
MDEVTGGWRKWHIARHVNVFVGTPRFYVLYFHNEEWHEF